MPQRIDPIIEELHEVRREIAKVKTIMGEKTRAAASA